MQNHRCDVLIIGAGPAGLSAARSAQEFGAHTVLVDREERLGGILKQCIHDGFGTLRYAERLTGPEYAHREIESVLSSTTICRPDTTVFNLTHDRRGDKAKWTVGLVSAAGGIEEITSTGVIIAAGCRERSDRQVFLHGDRPAGIFTAGQAQRLVNLYGVLPGRRVVILGSGDIGLIMARRLTLEGAEVIGVFEIQASPSGLNRNLALCLEDWNIPLHLQTTVTAVHGERRVSAVTVAPVDEEGIPIRSESKLVECDTLILSVGLVPEIDLLSVVGIEVDNRTGGPKVTQTRESNLPGLFTCGNALLVYDLVDYVSECGRLAGRRAAAYANESKHQSHRIHVDVSPEIGVCVPQYLDTEDGTPPVFFLRPRSEIETGIISVYSGANSNPTFTRRLRYIRPQEMIRIQLSPEAWTDIRERPERVTLVLEGENDENG